jgi:hypothetical protein
VFYFSGSHRLSALSSTSSGFGRGDFSILLGTLYPNASITGMDAHELSVMVANKNLINFTQHHGPLPNVQFRYCPVSEMPQEEHSYDVITTMGVNHHIFPDEEFVRFLKHVRLIGKKAFIFNDLYRSVPLYAVSSLFLNGLREGTAPYLLPFLSAVHSFLPLELLSDALAMGNVIANRLGADLIIDGAIKSMEKAFTVSELREMFRRAGYPDESLKCEYFVIPSRMVCYADLR